MKHTGILYKDISQDIKKQILNDNYHINTLIPTEEELSDYYGVSKITIRNAVEILVKEGYLIKKSGKGTIVISNRPFNNLSRAESFSSVLETKGYNVKKKVLEIIDVTKTNKIKGFDKDQAPITEITRLYTLDEKPFIYTIHNVAVTIDLALKDSLMDRSLYNVLSAMGISLNEFKDSFEVVKPASEIKKLLNLKGETILRRTRHGYDQYGTLVEVSYSYYNTEVHPYQIDYMV